MTLRQAIATCLMVCLAGVSSAGCEEYSDYEGDLAEVINAYRQDMGLPPIPISPSLTKVAEMHIWDLESNNPDVGSCNMHSWSDSGPWTGCCYTSDHAQAQCMWDKPREITVYQGNGYEISAWSTGITANSALDQWRSSSGHHDVILNRVIWSDITWQAVGAAHSNNYAVVWFGKEIDPAP